ncbi:MAG: hypothetical protein OQK78_03635, partial [Gammaproteobacteria bacterium]|nr:hypothetical protein [Gammaproteobacteria bacterium]
MRLSAMQTAIELERDSFNLQRDETGRASATLSGGISAVTADIGNLIDEVDGQRYQIDAIATAINQMAASVQEVAHNTAKASTTA